MPSKFSVLYLFIPFPPSPPANHWRFAYQLCTLQLWYIHLLVPDFFFCQFIQIFYIHNYTVCKQPQFCSFFPYNLLLIIIYFHISFFLFTLHESRPLIKCWKLVIVCIFVISITLNHFIMMSLAGDVLIYSWCYKQFL